MVLLKKFLKFVGVNHFIMPQEISYHEFCRLYVNDAMSIASLIIKKIDDPDGKGKEHRIHPLVDKDSVKAIAVSYTLDKVYKTYDVNHERGASIRTYLSFILQNCIITELKKAWTDVKRNHPELVKQKDAVRESLTEKRVVTGVKGRGSDLIKSEAHTYMYAGGASERKEQVIERMVACIQKLNPMDQVILNCWMYEKDNYVNKSLELLGYEITTKSQGMIRARLKRAQAALAKMMGGSKPDYRDIYIPSGKEAKDAVKLEPVDRNLERRRARAIKREMGTQINYYGIAEKLYTSNEE